MEHIIRQTFFKILSIHFPLKIPMAHPMAKPIMPENAHAVIINAKEVANFSLITSRTGLR